MKKVLVSIISGSAIIIFCIFYFYQEPPKGVEQANCTVMEQVYIINESRNFGEKITDDFFEQGILENYKLYGVISSLVEDFDHEKDLTTNYEEFMDKEVYINKKDKKIIYLKFDENKYLKLIDIEKR